MQLSKLKTMVNEVKRYKYIHVQPVMKWELEKFNYDCNSSYEKAGAPSVVDPGVCWGKVGETGIFRKEIVIPGEYKGYAVYLEVVTGGEGQVFIGGSAYQGNDPNHYRILLEECSTGGEHYDVKIESFVRLSPSDLGQITNDLASSGEFRRADLCAVCDDAEQFIYDLEFALQLAEEHEELRGAIEDAITRFFISLDITSREEFLCHVAEGRKCVAGVLDNIKAEDPQHTVWMIGQSHLDLAWFWRASEANRKTIRTFSTVLRYMRRYPFYRFMMPQAKLYKLAKDTSPDIFRQIKEKVAEGSWETAGLLYLEPDTNLVSGEWLVRNILLGRRFYEAEFGKVPQVESLIDAFGYSGNIPQILKKSGIKAVMLTKMMWYNDTNPFPYSAFVWKGIDGSDVLVATMPWFNRPCTPHEIKANVGKNRQKAVNDIPVFFGWGDGGGGADENHLESLNRALRWYRPAKIVSGTLAGFFEKLAEEKNNLPAWWGEIYLEGHRGCYTTQGRNKQMNRKCEDLYRSLGWLSGFLIYMDGNNHYVEMEDGCERIITNQFHDILPGSSIGDVYEDSMRQYKILLADGMSLLGEILHELNSMIDTQGGGIPVILWNLNSFPTSSSVKVKWAHGCAGSLRDLSGKDVPYVVDGGELAFVAQDMPSMGYCIYHFVPGGNVNGRCGPAVCSPASSLENQRYRIRWNESMQLTSIYDKKYGREVIKGDGIGNTMTLYFDYPSRCDAWDIDPDYAENCEVLAGELIDGPSEDGIKRWITVRYSTPKSTIMQKVVLYKGLDRIDFITEVEWNEKHRLLKSVFDLDIQSFKVVYDIPFGVIERDNHPNNNFQKAQFEVPGLSFADISEGNYGVALISPHKSGFSAKDGRLGISLLRSPAFPDPKADQGKHEFTYSLFTHENEYGAGGTVHQSGMLLHPVIACTEKIHNGSYPRSFNFFGVTANVILESLKLSESRDSLVLRVYEAYGWREKAIIEVGFPVIKVVETNLVEEPVRDIETDGRNIAFEISPFEIKTFKLYLDNKRQ